MNRLPMNRPHRRQVLECASPLALSTTHDFQSARGLAHSKTLARFSLRQSDPAIQGFKARKGFRRILTPEHRCSRSPRRRRRAAAFSLIELLLVMAIIAILASLYLGATSGSNQARQQKSCQKNLQRIFIALEIYATDHAGRFPEVAGARTSAAALDGLVPRYTADTASFICPGSNTEDPPSGESIARRKISYAYYMGRRRGNAAEVLMSDEQVDSLAKTVGQLAFSATGAAPGNNHQKLGGNFLFLDGRAETTPARLPFSLVLTQGVVLLNP